MMMRSALSTTYWLVAPRWMIPFAAGAASSNVCTWAITSWRSRFSCRAACSKSMSSSLAAIWRRASSLIRLTPNSRSARASSSHNRRHSPNLCRGENKRSISGPALRLASGDS